MPQDDAYPVPIPNPLDDYAATRDAFTWDLPESFNFGGDVIDRWAQDPEHLALIWCNADGAEERYTYADIAALTNRLANALKDAGIGKGDRVIVMLPRIPAWQIAMVACMKLGAVPIPCISMLTAKDIVYRAGHSGAKAAITTADNCTKFDGLDTLGVRIAVTGRYGDAPTGWTGFDTALDGASDRFDPVTVGLEDPAILYYTSGSTGDPKGVTHGARGLYTWRAVAWYWQSLRPGETIWCTADTGWSKAGTSILFGPWSCGATVLFYDGPFDPAARWELLRKYQVTVYCAAATELRRLIHEGPGGDAPAALRLTVSAGESVNPEVVHRWREITGSPLLDGYGQTETLMTIVNYPSVPVKAGSMGKPLPGVEAVILRDGADQIAETGESGRLAIRLPNPQMMLGYWNDTDRTKACIAEVEGVAYFITGDRAYQDADGYLFYTGRDDDVISSAGYRIGPMEVENALIEHPAVRESAAVASPDPERGEIVAAYIVLNPGYGKDAALITDLQDFTKRTTAPYKYPRKIVFVDDLPKTVTGKIRRRDLRDREFAQAGV